MCKKSKNNQKCCPKNTPTKAVRASRQDKEENLDTPKKDADTQDLMEDAAVALTSLSKGEVLFEKKAQNEKKKAVLAGSKLPKTKKKLNFDLDLNISECVSDKNSSADNSSVDNSSFDGSSVDNSFF